VGREPDDIGYLRIAGILRADITSGRIPPGGRLPSESQLMIRHDVSRSVVKWAIAVLKADGLADGRQGVGVFVRSPQRQIREPDQAGVPSSLHRHPARDVNDELDPWPHQAQEVLADAEIARRLSVAPGTPLCRSRYREVGPGPQQLVTSWQSAATRGLMPQRLSERVIARPARPEEINALGLPARGCILQIARTYSTDGIPIETANIVLAIDRVELHYELPAN
jgi:GntR family transcriptional regulator